MGCSIGSAARLAPFSIDPIDEGRGAPPEVGTLGVVRHEATGLDNRELIADRGKAVLEHQLTDPGGVQDEKRVCKDDHRVPATPACGLERPFEVGWPLDEPA